MNDDEKYAEYLGDGVYASYRDGYVILTTGHHDEYQADNVIAFEPEVLRKLMDYLAALPSKMKANKEV